MLLLISTSTHYHLLYVVIQQFLPSIFGVFTINLKL